MIETDVESVGGHGDDIRSQETVAIAPKIRNCGAYGRERGYKVIDIIKVVIL